MATYLKKFNTHAEYEEYIEELGGGRFIAT